MSIIDYPDGSTNANTLVLTDNSTQLQVTSGTATQSGIISESGGSFGLQKIGSGTLIYTGVNSYTGLTTISGGTLQIDNVGPSHLIGYDILDNGVLVFNNPDSFLLGTISGSGSVVILSGYTTFTANASYTGGTTINSGATLEIGGTVGALTGDVVDNGTFAPYRQYDGVISGSGIVHIRPAINPIVLSGTSTYTGATQLDQNAYLVVTGSIANSTINLPAYAQLGGTGTVGTTTVGDSSSLTPGAAAGAIGTLSIAGDLTIAGGTYAVDLAPGSADKVQVSGTTTIAPNSGLNIAVVANATYTPGVYTLLSSAGNLSGQFLYVNYYYPGNFSSGIVPFISYDAHNVFLTLSQEKTWLSLPGTNLFADAANWNSGTVPGSGETAVFGSSSITTIAVNGPVTIGGMRFAGSFPRYTFNVSGNLTFNNQGIVDPLYGFPAFNVANGGSLAFTGFATSGNAAINVAQGGVLFFSGAAYPGTGRIDGPGGIMDIGGIDRTTFGISSLGTIGTIDLGGKTLLVTGGATVSANIVDNSLSNGSHPSSLRITGGGVFFTGTGSYTGGTFIDPNGTLRLGNYGATGSIAGNVADDGELSFARTDTVTFGGVISGVGRVTQYSGGTTILTATNTYTGTTTVNAGTLLVDGSIASSAVTMWGGGVVGGSGTVGTTSVQAGGTLTPGDAPGAISNLHVNGNLTFQVGGALSEDISAAAADQIIVSGNASLGGQLAVNFAGSSFGHQTFTLLHANGGMSGAFATVAMTGLPAGLDAYVTYDTNNAYLTINHAPVVTTADQTLAAGQSTTLASLINVTDADGDSMTRYQLYDGTGNLNSGHFVINAQVQSSNIVLDITAVQAAQTSFVGGTVADNIQIRAFDGHEWSAADSANWAPFVISPPINHAPVVTTSDRTLAASQSLSLASLVSVSDADGDSMTRYQLYDVTSDPSSGHFMVNGVTQPSRIVIDLTAAQAAQTSFIGGTIADNIQIRVYDGQAWSAADSANWAPFVISPPVNHAPVVTTSDRTLAAGQSISLAGLVSVSDADGDSMTRYQLYDVTSDPSSGHFMVNGVAQPSRIVIDLTAAQAAQTSFIGGTVADNIQIRAYDGEAWSAADSANWAPFAISPPVNHAPVVTTANTRAAAGQSITLANLISVSDADGDAITRYQLYDATGNLASGHFVINGQVQSSNIVLDITAAQAAQTSFTGGTVNDDLQIRAFDGQVWSAPDSANWAPFTFGPAANNPPVVTTSNLRATAGQSITLANLISVNDAEGDAITRYQLYDATGNSGSGHFVINGQVQSSNIVLDITAAQAAQTSFMVGTVNDDIQIRAFDGQAWSAADSANWAPFILGPAVNNPPVVTTVDHIVNPGQSLPLASLISVTDADGDSMTRYQLYDVTSDPSSGHFMVNGVAQPSRIVIDLTAAQAAQTSFLTGTIDDDLQIRAFDGHAWSAADSANWSPFHIFG